MRQLRVYAASSWKNQRHPEIVEAMREAECEVYDFRNPAPGNTGFSWDDIDPSGAWHTTTDPQRLRELLRHPVAQEGFGLDMQALEAADVCVLTLPCGRSAHLELGYAVGEGKRTAVLLDGESGPELMYGMVDRLCSDVSELLWFLEAVKLAREVSA